MKPEDFAKIEARLNAKGHGVVGKIPAASPVVVPTEPAPILAKVSVLANTDEEKLNKTEAAFLAFLRGEKRWAYIGVQTFTLKLADDTRYTPDFICVGHGGEFVAFETKGFWRDDARVKIKVAARQFPFLQFTAVTRTKGGGWEFEAFKR
ncbi:MAG: hypothetical protein K0R17_3556 [Rariglobus sp.]|jgi:hypothetical protein|nr:hypothetical protein [Rariglobus sp.]